MSDTLRPSMSGTPTNQRTSPITGLRFTPFKLGRLVGTPGALGLLEAAHVHPFDLLSRHMNGDWGNIDPGDYGLNEEATRTGARILSVYVLPVGRVWVITDGDDEDGVRHSTTILLPDEY